MLPKDKLLIVIATYNEMENLPPLVERLLELLPEASILVVDDNSPDGTGRWSEEEAERNERFFCIVREGKLGLGSATVAGFEFGLNHHFSYVGTMDADWSHDPEAMQRMWNDEMRLDSACGKEPGVVIGSRYVAGGAIDGWPWFRRFSSRFVNRFVRLVLGLPTKDNTGALRIYSSDALRLVDVQNLNAKGYGYLEELLFRLFLKRIPMREMPIRFVDREKGKSKASVTEGIRVLWSILRLLPMRFSKSELSD